jgi:hypothetical protein
LELVEEAETTTGWGAKLATMKLSWSLEPFRCWGLERWRLTCCSWEQLVGYPVTVDVKL